jgi:hypothetical protein
MRFEASVTSVSWIPSESVSGMFKAGFAVGASRFDDPPPEVLQDLGALFAAEGFRFANRARSAASPISSGWRLPCGPPWP